jgi:hypothetical protein
MHVGISTNVVRFEKSIENVGLSEGFVGEAHPILSPLG